MNAISPIAPRARISASERAERQNAIDYARRSVGYEGFTLPAEYEALSVRYVNGEIDNDEMNRLTLKIAGLV